MNSRPARHIVDFQPGGSWVRAVAFALGVMSGLISMLSSAGLPRAPRAARRQSAGRTRRAAGAWDHSTLRTAIFGHSKREVAHLLGPPPTALLGESQPPGESWQANTWYYPFDARRHTAVAVEFDNDRVIRVDHIGGLV